MKYLRQVIYHPSVNYVIRHGLRPFAGMLPEDLQVPVTGTIAVRLENGQTIRIACNPTSYPAKTLFYRGERGYEYSLTRVFTKLIQQSTLFIDVGANIGYYSLLAAAYNPSVHIGSFEPLPAAYTYLLKNISINGLETAIYAHQIALSDEAGQRRFTASRSLKFDFVDDQLTTTGGFDSFLSRRSERVETFEVETIRLDDAVEMFWPEKTVALIKIDVEGSEYLVLAGAERLLTKDRPILLCEILSTPDAGATEALLRDRKYEFFQPGDEGVVHVDTLMCEDRSTKNYILVPRERTHSMTNMALSCKCEPIRFFAESDAATRRQPV